jgi:hypothetical protein
MTRRRDRRSLPQLRKRTRHDWLFLTSMVGLGDLHNVAGMVNSSFNASGVVMRSAWHTTLPPPMLEQAGLSGVDLIAASNCSSWTDRPTLEAVRIRGLAPRSRGCCWSRLFRQASPIGFLPVVDQGSTLSKDLVAAGPVSIRALSTTYSVQKWLVSCSWGLGYCCLFLARSRRFVAAMAE